MPVDLRVHSTIITNKVKGWTTIPNDANMDPAFAPIFQNINLSRQGAIEKRFGHQPINAVAIDGDITSVMEWCSDAADLCEILVGTDAGKVYQLETTNEFTLLGSGFDTTGKFRAANFNGKLYMGNGVDTPQQYDGTTLSAWTPSAGTIPKFKYIHAHEGRIVVAGGPDLGVMVARHSSLELPNDWAQLDPDDNPTTGFDNDLSFVLPKGDTLTSITTQDGYIVYQCKNHLVAYNLSTDIRTFSLVKVVRGQGCPAPDGNELVGNEAYVWARYGVKSLKETAATENVELGKDISEPIDNELTDRLQAAIDNGLEDRITMINYQKRSLLILNYPVNAGGTQYRQAVYNYRFKVWSEWTGQNFKDVFASSSGKLYGAGAGGILFEMDTSGSDNSTVIAFKWETPWLYLGDTAKIKDMDAADIVIANDDTVNMSMKWYFDIIESNETENTDTWTFGGPGPYWSESGIDPIFQFDELWTGSGKSSPLPFPMFGYGLTLKMIFENNEINTPFTFEYIRLDYNIGSRASGR